MSSLIKLVAIKFLVILSVFMVLSFSVSFFVNDNVKAEDGFNTPSGDVWADFQKYGGYTDEQMTKIRDLIDSTEIEWCTITLDKEKYVLYETDLGDKFLIINK